MKTITCIHCEDQFSGETPREVQMAMLPHYKNAHPEIINGVDESERTAWMQEFNRRWENA